MVDKNSELYGMSRAGAILYLQEKEKEKERLEPKKLELAEPVPTNKEVLEQVDLIVLTLKDALNERTLHRRELLLEDVAINLKTLQKSLHALLEDKSHKK